MFLRPRKVGLALDTFFEEDDTLYFARIDLVYGKENEIISIYYNPDDTFKVQLDVR